MDNCFASNRYVKPQDLFQVVRTVIPTRRGQIPQERFQKLKLHLNKGDDDDDDGDAKSLFGEEEGTVMQG